MKKLFVLIGFLFLYLFCLGQESKVQIKNRANHNYDFVNKQAYIIPNPDVIPLINVTLNIDENNNGWSLIGNPCVGCASYFFKILRSTNPIKAENGFYYYYFYFYFYSNSYLNKKDENNNYILTGTNLSEVSIYVGDDHVTNIPYILLEPGKIVYAAWVRSGNPYSHVRFQPTKVTVY